jgi:phosphopantothenoylcysteine decarboxylase/phosphopantothenate--cysteine ligase
MMLKDKRILLGITGGIAAYKAAELTREFVRWRASVKVVMTKNAMEFITPLTLQTLSGNPVYTDMFSLERPSEITHISLADYADILIIAPASANVIGRIAAGLADDLLTTVILATKAPILICPAMNTNMMDNPVVKDNIARLSERGFYFMDPEWGELACKVEGRGRLPDAVEIADEAETILTAKDLVGERILVTAGPTREPFDPVRYITNYSSGKMGYALARCARNRGADVVLISGPTALTRPRGVRFIPVSSAAQMRDAVMEELDTATAVIKAAAVADYRPSVLSERKIKKKEGGLTIDLERNTDIIAEVGKKKGNRILVGFAMESHNLIENATAKMLEKNMDFIVANDVTQEGAGFQTDTNIVKILDRSGGIGEYPLMDKQDVADRILDRIRLIRTAKNS